MIHQDPIGDLREWYARQPEIDRHVELLRLAREERGERWSHQVGRRASIRGLVQAIFQVGGRLAPSTPTMPAA